MKRIICLTCALFVSLCLFAQVQITTKKEKLSDFRTKTTKIVLSGHVLLDSALKEAVKNTWTISPFEFCTAEESKQFLEDDYYLLIMAESLRKGKGCGVIEFKLLKGGSKKGIDKCLEVTCFPLCASDFSSGRELTFLPAILHILQQNAIQVVDYGRNGRGSYGVQRDGESVVYFVREDLRGDAGEAVAELGGMTVVDADVADSLFEAGADALVSYSIACDPPIAGQDNYVMMIDAYTHRLCYINKRKISARKGPGFSKSDVKSIAASIRE